jgi:3-methyladenine DNA glycosylase AlkD
MSNARVRAARRVGSARGAPVGKGALAAKTAAQARKALRAFANPAKALKATRFFRTGKGEYGEGDKFIGGTTPEIRGIAREFRDLPLREVVTLLRSSVHEERTLALMILVLQFDRAGRADRGDSGAREKIYRLYLRERRHVNNWDLVDGSAPYIVGAFLFESRDRSVLFDLAGARSLWDRRIAIVATWYLIRKGDFADALRISALLRDDTHDLIHKAVGWMLREIGKRDVAVLEKFLEKHAAHMPRTMLRYSLERLTPTRRKYFMARAELTCV